MTLTRVDLNEHKIRHTMLQRLYVMHGTYVKVASTSRQKARAAYFKECREALEAAILALGGTLDGNKAP